MTSVVPFLWGTFALFVLYAAGMIYAVSIYRHNKDKDD